MYNRESILKALNEENYYIDKHSLNSFLNAWKIDSIYEDENGFEFYDNLSLDKLKRGISLKAQGYCDEEIVSKINKIVATTICEESPKPIEIKNNNSKPMEIVEEQEKIVSKPEKSFTLDVTSQTLQMLAEAVAKKISDDITNSDMATRLIEAGGYKKDNEIMAKQIQELLEHNKILSEKIEKLERHTLKGFWKSLWGQK